MIRRLAVAALTGGLVLALAAPAGATPGPSDAPQWWFDTWQVPSLWDAGARGQGITIAEVDTGVSGDVPELAANLLPGKDFGASHDDGRVDHEVDQFGHGTAMASIMVAQPGLLGITGLAPDAKVLPIAVPIRGTDDAAGDSGSSGDQVPQAIRWAADHGGKVISLSLGGKRDPATDAVPCPADEQAAITYAIGKGAIVVAASGNSGDKGSPVEDPGVCLGVVSVGAVDRSNTVADFSSRHPYLTVTAPGVDIPSLGRVAGTAFAGSGTSQATAMTSAVLALVWSKYPTLTGRQVVARLLATLDRPSPTRDPAYGYGIVNAQRAITATVPATAANPVYAAVDPFLAAQRAADRANAAPPARPAPPTTAPGEFAVGAPPSKVTGQVITGTVVSLLGVLAFVLLAGVGLRHRRQDAPAYAGHLASPGPAGPFGPAPVVPPPHRTPPAAAQPPAAPSSTAPMPGEDQGVVWHDVSGPVWPYPPPGSLR